MTQFSSNWQEKRNRESTSDRIKQAMNQQGDLRKRLTDSDRSLSNQISRLDRTIANMTEKEKKLFSMTTSSFQRHDTGQAHAYANELTEHRKAMKLVQSSKLSLEQVQMRLKTVTDIGDLANAISPVGLVVKTVRRSLQGVMPSANDTLSEINAGFEGMMQDIGSLPGMNFSFDTNSEEAEKILAEASVIAETKMTGTLPSIPDISEDAANTSI